MIITLPKIFGMLGDSIQKSIDFNCVVVCGGQRETGETWYYSLVPFTLAR